LHHEDKCITGHCRIKALCFTLTEKCGHNLNQTNDVQDATKFSTGSWKEVYHFRNM